MRLLLVLLLSTSLLAAPVISNADEYELAPVAYFSVGLMIVDAGVSVANGFALANGTANKPNSYFSIGAGIVSYGLVAAAYATSDADNVHDFAVVMGTAGTAALVTGIFGLRQANSRDDSSGALSRIRAYPTVVSDGGGHSGPGIQLKINF
jgi:hypothetical protein